MTASLSPVTARDQERRGRTLSGVSLFAGTWQVGAYFWIAVVVITVALALVLDTWADGGVDQSLADGTLGSAPIFLSVMGLIMPLGVLPLHLAGGGTRRSLSQGIAAAAVALGATFGLVGAIGMLVEYVTFRGLGWSTASSPDALYDSSGDFFTIWLTWGLSGAAYFLAGAAIALGYYRWGKLLGTVQLLVAVALVVAGDLALGGGLSSGLLGSAFGDRFPVAVGSAVSVASIGALGWLVHRTLRGLPVRPSSRAC